MANPAQTYEAHLANKIIRKMNAERARLTLVCGNVNVGSLHVLITDDAIRTDWTSQNVKEMTVQNGLDAVFGNEQSDFITTCGEFIKDRGKPTAASGYCKVY